MGNIRGKSKKWLLIHLKNVSVYMNCASGPLFWQIWAYKERRLSIMRIKINFVKIKIIKCLMKLLLHAWYHNTQYGFKYK